MMHIINPGYSLPLFEALLNTVKKSYSPDELIALYTRSSVITGQTLLTAATKSRTDIAKILLEQLDKKININIPDSTGYTAFNFLIHHHLLCPQEIKYTALQQHANIYKQLFISLVNKDAELRGNTNGKLNANMIIMLYAFRYLTHQEISQLEYMKKISSISACAALRCILECTRGWGQALIELLEAFSCTWFDERITGTEFLQFALQENNIQLWQWLRKLHVPINKPVALSNGSSISLLTLAEFKHWMIPDDLKTDCERLPSDAKLTASDVATHFYRGPIEDAAFQLDIKKLELILKKLSFRNMSNLLLDKYFSIDFNIFTLQKVILYNRMDILAICLAICKLTPDISRQLLSYSVSLNNNNAVRLLLFSNNHINIHEIDASSKNAIITMAILQNNVDLIDLFLLTGIIIDPKQLKLNSGDNFTAIPSFLAHFNDCLEIIIPSHDKIAIREKISDEHWIVFDSWAILRRDDFMVERHLIKPFTQCIAKHLACDDKKPLGIRILHATNLCKTTLAKLVACLDSKALNYVSYISADRKNFYGQWEVYNAFSRSDRFVSYPFNATLILDENKQSIIEIIAHFFIAGIKPSPTELVALQKIGLSDIIKQASNIARSAKIVTVPVQVTLFPTPYQTKEVDSSTSDFKKSIGDSKKCYR